jgi:hypothetical protein
MSANTRINNVLSDPTSGDAIGLVGASGREVAHPGSLIDSSGTPGAATQQCTHGRCAIANRNIMPQSTVIAVLSGAAADSTLTSILRVTPANGSVTITGNANATAAVQIDYVVFGLLVL